MSSAILPRPQEEILSNLCLYRTHVNILHWVRSAVKQGASATSPNPSEEIFDLYGCGWEIERIEHNLRAKALKISSYARFFVFLPIR